MRVFTMDTRLGPITVWESDNGLVRLDFTHASVERIEKYYGCDIEWTNKMESVRQLDAYLNGRLFEFNLPLDIDATGTDFQRRAWRALLTIPYGETITYADLAARMGSPTAIRAAGQANNRNPIAIVIPCHRVIRTNGDLGGYNGGVERKRALINMEKARMGAYHRRKLSHPNVSGIITDAEQGTIA
ncbi:MAG: methylated-DNA--[protein]-cysteine S-methyltransferase [Oscillospiraceae bacterium]|jgi:methylated-DNA-[protein]-cysteine S-methyltransferase|nr:methylated-DNA--[protein]-cysteine S-methyltransferase [Oscillospiraceae bacterium]